MTRSYILTQMERLVDRLQSDHAPYTIEDAHRLRELRFDLEMLAEKALKQPPLDGWQKRMAENNVANLNEKG